MSKNKKPRLSPAESEILSLVWNIGQATVQEVHEALPKGREIVNTTVQTLLRRLEKKGYVARQRQGKAHVFWATVEKEEVVDRSVKELAENHFQGDTSGLLLYIAKHGTLKEEDIARLRQLLDTEQKGKSSDES
jgi:BlaI family penicillinase repressor